MIAQEIFNQLAKEFDWEYVYECKLKLNMFVEKTKEIDIKQMKKDFLLIIKKTIERERACEYRNFLSFYENGNIAIVFHIQKSLFLKS
jgi:hypothetical protein